MLEVQLYCEIWEGTAQNSKRKRKVSILVLDSGRENTGRSWEIGEASYLWVLF